jgi:hypothetical protein
VGGDPFCVLKTFLEYFVAYEFEKSLTPGYFFNCQPGGAWNTAVFVITGFSGIALFLSLRENFISLSEESLASMSSETNVSHIA